MYIFLTSSKVWLDSVFLVASLIPPTLRSSSSKFVGCMGPSAYLNFFFTGLFVSLSSAIDDNDGHEWWFQLAAEFTYLAKCGPLLQCAVLCHLSLLLGWRSRQTHWHGLQDSLLLFALALGCPILFFYNKFVFPGAFIGALIIFQFFWVLCPFLVSFGP